MESPILVRLFKEESELEVWKQDREGRFALLKTYPICRWSGELGPKVKEGDRQAPEGFYNITPGQMNPNSQYYLSFDLGYPNAYDRAYGRTGAQLMVHGDCSSRGCYSMTDEQISEIYALGRDSFFGGQKSFQVQAYPFRMTAQNLARHRNNPNIAFWKMLKKGNDHFEVTQPRAQGQCLRKRYVFDAQSPSGTRRCRSAPAAQVPGLRRCRKRSPAWCATRSARTNMQFADLSRRNIATAPIKTNADGGMHPVFVEAVKKNQIGVAPQEPMLPGVDGRPEPFRRRCGRRASPSSPDAPVVAGTGRTPAVPARGRADRRWPLPRPSPRPAAAKSSGSSLFGSLFASKSAEANGQPATKPRSTAWRRWSACAATTPNPRSGNATAQPKPKPRGQADQRGFAWRDPRRGRPRPSRSRPPKRKPPAAPAAAAPAPARPSPRRPLRR